jgi:hypothetical protein
MTPDDTDDATVMADLFDPAFYLAEYPDVRAAGVDPAAHFRQYGWREGRNPNAAFDTSWYLRSHPEIEPAGSNPLVHYARVGEPSGARPSARFDPGVYRRLVGIDPQAPALSHFLARAAAGLPPPPGFDARWYLQAYPDVALAEADPFAHYLLYGAAEGRTPGPDAAIIEASGLFDASYYLLGNPDVGEQGRDPLEHFCVFGWREGRRPNPYFDPSWYRQTYMRDLPLPMNPLTHYALHGEAADLKPCVYFETGWYRRVHRLADEISPLRHYLRHRRSQRVSPTPLFDHLFYLRTYAARIGPNRDPFAHFLVHGAREDLDPSADFSSAVYRARHMTASVAPRPGQALVEADNPLVHFLLRQGDTMAEA